MTRVVHLVSRFFGSLRPPAIDAATRTWVNDALNEAERQVWEGMGRADRAESVAVARRLDAALAGVADAPDARWRAAALVHDVGKQVSAYGPFGRAMATTVTAIAGDERARDWAARAGGARARIGQYAAHDDLGAELLRLAGARPEAAAWAEAHHRPACWGESGIPIAVCRALAVADGESVGEA